VTYVPGTNDKATANVTLTLSAISAGDCTPASDDIHVVLTPCTGIDDPGSAIFGLVMTPNPTSGLFALTVNGVKNQEVRISVTTLQGSSVLERKINSARNSMTEKIDLSGYAKGVYVVKVSAGENTTSGKVVVR
ncbi:MAG: T9SS type A sorting domain-containing protein, partial [Syntrophothermus sp.]